MRMILDLPKGTAERCYEDFRGKTETALVVNELERIIRVDRLQRLKRFQGKVDLSIDLDCLRNRNRGGVRRTIIDK